MSFRTQSTSDRANAGGSHVDGGAARASTQNEVEVVGHVTQASTSTPTAAQLSALKWLINRNRDGVFDRNQILVAAGERAPVMRGTWTRLEALGMVERYHDNRRLRVTDLGRMVNLTDVYESEG